MVDVVIGTTRGCFPAAPMIRLSLPLELQANGGAKLEETKSWRKLKV